jgi:hypothetical protein
MSMPPQPTNPLPRLREIRDAQKAAQKLMGERNRLIRQALAQGTPERQVAAAAGLSPGRVHQIGA